ncbi:MBL fold metallo-hydrolase [Candidatus Thorarchaeota archaeon]|nr:MAG: MBL fold metallo-hydrolase [Candidatus Thorarchaeota archaeon]
MDKLIDLRPIDRLEIVILVDNTVCTKDATEDIVTPASGWVKPKEGELDLRSGHGLALLVKTELDDKTHQVLYDTGPSDELLLYNAEVLGLDLTETDAIAISHGHWDHMGGLLGALRAIGKSEVPVYLHNEMFRKRGIKSKILFWTRIRELDPVPAKKDIERFGGEPTHSPNPTLLANQTLMVGGEIPRITSYEKGFPGHVAYMDGEWVPDQDVIDDSCLVAHVRDKGLVVMAGCSHAGIANITRHASNMIQQKDILNIIGGFHLSGKNEVRIEPTINDLQKYSPHYITPIHCTGSKAQHMMRKSFGDRYIKGCVGDRFVFEA